MFRFGWIAPIGVDHVRERIVGSERMETSGESKKSDEDVEMVDDSNPPAREKREVESVCFLELELEVCFVGGFFVG